MYARVCPEYAHVRFTVFVIPKFAVGITVVVTVFEILLPVIRSNVLHVIVAKFDNVHHVTFTVQVMIILPTQPLKRLHIL